MIRGYIGLLGQGKTLNMVYDLIAEMKTGRRVISNTPIIFDWKGKRYQAALKQSARELERSILNEEDAIIAIDEASIFFPSYFWNKLSAEYIMRFAQARKYGLDFYFTSQGWNHTISRLRDLTNEVVKCKSFKIPFTPFGIFRGVVYDPEFFAQRIISSPTVEKQYILRTRTLFPSDYRFVMKAYQTMYRVEASALAEVKINKPKLRKNSMFDLNDIDDI